MQLRGRSKAVSSRAMRAMFGSPSRRRKTIRGALFWQGKAWTHWRWNFDFDFERRDNLAALHFDLDRIVIDREVLRNHRQNFFPKNSDEVGLAGHGALMREQDLQPFPGDRRSAWAPKEIHESHAALRPNSLPNRLFLSLGIVTS